MKTKVSSWALVLLSSMLTIFVLLCSGIALAYANGPGDSDYEDLWSEFFAPQAAESNQSNALPTGMQIFQSDGTTPAVEPTDYEVNGLDVNLKTNDLVIKGGTEVNPVEARIIVDGSTNSISKLTLDNLHIFDETSGKSTISIVCPSGNEDNPENPDFTLSIKNYCTIYQTQNDNGQQALNISGGSGNGISIEGVKIADKAASLEIVAQYMDAIFVQTAEPVTFSGDMAAAVYSVRDDGIDWSAEGDHSSLTLTDNVSAVFGSEQDHKFSAIDAGSLYINGSASLTAVSRNRSTQNVPVIKTIDDFTVDTEGFVFVDAYNEWSWQAIDCNKLTINKCDEGFTAVAWDYPAVVCHSSDSSNPDNGVFKISDAAAPKVYLSGGFAPKKETDHRAIRGAFTVQFPNKFVVPDGYLMYGSESKWDEITNITKRAVTTFSSGYALETNTPEFDVYTPVIPDWNGLAESKYAHSVVFRQAEELIFVPGQKPGYNNAGYRDCYKFKDSETYFEDYDQKIPIDNIAEWRSEGGAGFLNPLGIDFNAYRETVLAQCDLIFDRGDRPEVAQLTNAAKKQIENYLYDVSLSMSSNKSKLDAIYNQLVTDTDALALPVPEPWIPPTPVNPENTGTSQTGDGFPLWVAILLAAVAAAAGIVAWRKRELIKAKLVANGSSSSVAKTGFIVTLFGAVIVPIMLLLGLVVANAGANTDAASSSEGINNLLFTNPFVAQYNEGEYPGITITKDGQPATPDVDYEADPTTNKTILIKSNGLTVSGGTALSPIDVSITTANNVTDLTIKSLHIDTAREWTGPHDGHALILDWVAPSGADTKNFTLNVGGNCTIRQSNSTNGGSAIDILNEQGYGCNIHGEEGCQFFASSAYYESIFVHSGPLQFSGDLTANILAQAQRSIAWQEGAHDTDILALTDNVNVTCRTSHNKNFSAVQAGNIAVLNNASFIAFNNNGSSRDVATVDVRYYFGVNTTGFVRIGNLNPGSWQAIKCRTLSILNCENFFAFSSDYTAVECTNALTIQTPNVVFCGEYNRELTHNHARRGAITVDDPTKVYISPDIMAFGSQEAYDENIPTNLAFLVRTAGDDVAETDKLYTPAVCDGNIATIAKTISFKQTAHSLELVPGVAPTYTTPGYKDYYYCKDCGLYYEDVQGTSRIVFIEEWMSPWGNGYIPAIGADFEPYRAKMIEACNNMYIRADVPQIHALVETAQALISGYTYNDAESMAANKAMLDKVYYQLLDKVNNIQL